MNKKKIYYSGILVISVLFLWFFSIITSIKIGSYFYNQGNYSNALRFYKITSQLAPFWKKPNIRLSNTKKLIKEKEKQPINNSKIRLTFDKDVSIINKRVIKTQKPFNNYNGYMLVALLRNNTDYGIPFVKINKIEMLNKGNIVAVKENPFRGDFFMVANGEFPFYFYFITDEYPNLTVDDFRLETNISPFTPTEDVVRLDTQNLKRILVNQHQNKWMYYKYSITVKNPYKFEVKKIHRISILKDGLLPLNRLDTIERVVVIEKPKQNQEIINLNAKEKEVYLSLKPGESRTVEFEIKVEEIFNGYFSPEKVELTNYFTGVKE
jgi:hypothetical protein